MHNPSAFTLSFAFHASWLLMCWYFDAVRRRALSLFQFSKGSTGSALAHTDFFPYNLCAPPPFLFFTPMFNIKDEDSRRWGSNVCNLKACIYHLHFHSTVFQTYTKNFSHMDTQGGTQTEKERDLEARYRHKENERPALIQEEICT